MLNIRQGDVILLSSRRGPVHCVVAGERYMRGGGREYLLGPLQDIGKRGGYFRITDRHARLVGKATKSFKKADLEVATKKVYETRELRAEFDYKEREARREAQGEVVKWSPKAETENFKPGDTVTIKGPHYNWDATVVELNIATGKVGIKQEVPDWKKDEAARRREAFALGQYLAPDLMANRRAPRKPSGVRWLDPRFIVAVNGKPIAK